MQQDLYLAAILRPRKLLQ